MLIKKSWVSKLSVSPTTTAYLHDAEGFIHIVRTFMGRTVDERVLKLANVEEIEADCAGFWKSILGYGSLIFKAQGEVREKLEFVKNPRQYERIVNELLR